MANLLPPGKINTTKLLGGTTKNSAVEIKEESITVLKNDLLTIKDRVFQIRDLVGNFTLLKKKESRAKRKEQEKKKFEDREGKLEEKKEPKGNNLKLPSTPRLGFLDIIKRFVLNTLFGFIAVRLIDHLPKLIEVAKFLGGTLDFITDVGGKLLNGLTTFIQKGYEAYDFTRNQLKSFGGENAVKYFDGFNKALDGLFMAALAASFAFADRAQEDMGGGPGKGSRRGFDRTGRRVGVDTQRRYARRFGRDRFLERFGRQNLKNLPKKSVLKFVRPFTKRLPIIGALLDFGLSVAMGEPLGRAAFKAIGAGLLGSIGAALGGPFAILTGLAGGAVGDWAGGALYDLFFGNKKSNNKGVAKAAGGGKPVTRGGKLVSGPAKRAIKKQTKRTIAIQPTEIKPGANVGGEKKIEKVFPKSKDKSKISPLDYITSSYKNVSSAPFFGSIMGIAIKAVSGQKPSKLDYHNAAQGLSNWMNITFSNEILRTGSLYAAGGGEIDADLLARQGGDMTNAISKSLEESISKKVDDSIKDLMKQMMLQQPIKEPDKTDPTTNVEEDVPYGLTKGKWGPLLDLIAGKESGGNYEAMYPSTTLPGATKMTIAEVARRATGAVGKYQQLPEYLVGRAKAAGLDPNRDLYSPENQDLIITKVNIKGRGGERWLNGEISDEQFMQGLSQEFASIPNAQGKFYYAGQSSAMTPDKVKSALAKVRKGGYSKSELEESQSNMMTGTGKFKVIEYITGDRNHPNLDVGGHGLPSNYHDHIAFATVAEKEKAKSTLRRSGIQIGSEFRPGDPGFHGRNLAIDIPGEQWGGYGAIGSKEFAGSKRVRSVLGIGRNAPRFHGGFIPKNASYFLHKGEFVVDKDSVDLFGQDFIATINSIENKSQLKQKALTLMQSLSHIADYEMGGMQEVFIEDSNPEIVTVPMPIPMGGGGMIISGSGYDPTQGLSIHA